MSADKIWKLKDPLRLNADSIDSRQGPICPLVASLLRIRGIESPEAQEAFLFHKTLSYLANPWDLPDLPLAVERLVQAIHSQELIVIYGDYDVDGMTATTLLRSVLKDLGANVDHHIPDRQDEGYGLHIESLERLRSEGAKLVISVDCGITAHAEAAYALENGLDLIITDHHQPQGELPKAIAVINPKRYQKERPDTHLAGVGVAFKLAQCLCQTLNRPEAVFEYIDLVALGTVADVVPLQGDNRILVHCGMHKMNRNPGPGLSALIQISGLAGRELQTVNLAFGIAPRLNASGRLAKGSFGVDLLMETDSEKALSMARFMDEANKKRQIIEAAIAEDAAQKILTAVDLKQERMLILSSDQWHHGVIGIVASRLVEQYHRPVLLIAFDGNMGKGSGRSIHGFDLNKALHACSQWLSGYGGHAMAAGCSVEAAQYPALKQALLAYAGEHLTEYDMIPVKTADLELDASLLDMDFVHRMEGLAPFGAGNPQPVFVLRDAQARQLRTIGNEKQHLKFMLEAGSLPLNGIAFNMGQRQHEIENYESLDLMFVPEINVWNDQESLQLLIKDIKDHQVPDDLRQERDFIEQLFDEGNLWQDEDLFRDIAYRETFFTKVAGISFEDRQTILNDIAPGDAVTLRLEPDNAYDPNAVAVYFQERLLGYLKSGLARHLACSIRSGTSYSAYAQQITGRQHEKKGLNLCVYKENSASEPMPWNLKDQSNDLIEPACKDIRTLSADEQKDCIRQAILGQGKYHDKQLEAIDSLFQGRSTLLVMGTGRGKTAVFETAAASFAAQSGGMTLLVYPLRSLINDQYQRFQSQLSPLGIGVAIASGGLNSWERKALFKKLRQKQIQIIMTTPEFLELHKNEFSNIKSDLRLLVIDEAHHMGQSNRGSYKKLGKVWMDLGKPLVLAATATANKETAEKIQDAFAIQNVVLEAHCRQNLQLVDARGCDDKLTYLLELLTGEPRCVIYVNSRRQAYELASALRSYLPHLKKEIAYYHGGLDRVSRQTIERMFQQEQINVLVSTSAFGEGADVRNIRDVVLYHMCFAKSEYNQLSGRAGRDGQPARIHLLYDKKDHQLNQFILQSTAPDRQALGHFYLYLRDEAKRQNPLSLTNQEIAQAMKARGVTEIGERTIPACLGILEELGLLLREQDAGRRYIHLAPPPPTKLDLNHSSRFMEGQDESAAFAEYAEFAFSENLDLLLEGINRPILPTES